jgi:hypothetical protein
MNYIAWYFATGIVFNLILMGLLRKRLKKKDLPEMIAFFIDSILFWPIKLLRTIRAVYDFIFDITMIAFNCFRGKSRGNS